MYVEIFIFIFVKFVKSIDPTMDSRVHEIMSALRSSFSF